jgi:predicted transcriptional regulator
MESPIERVITDVLRYREATQRLIQGLENQVTSSDEDVEILRSGITMEAKMRRSNSAKLSRELTQRLEEFEEVRRDIRLSITSALRAEGLSAADIGELFGVTRQLASRFAREARALGSEDSDS